jgi:hypothetical protein
MTISVITFVIDAGEKRASELRDATISPDEELVKTIYCDVVESETVWEFSLKKGLLGRTPSEKTGGVLSGEELTPEFPCGLVVLPSSGVASPLEHD